MKKHIALWFVAGIVATGSSSSSNLRYSTSFAEPINRLEAEARERAETLKKQAEEAAAAQIQEQPQEQEAEIAQPTPQPEEETPAALMSRKEKREAARKAEIAEERAQETNRFKKKAIEDTEAREKKYEEIMERKQQKASRFQKEAAEKELQEKEQILEEENAPSRSRFTEKAKQRAEERAKKREEKSKRLRRNNK